MDLAKEPGSERVPQHDRLGSREAPLSAPRLLWRSVKC
jgi:hypothetical protein